MPGSVGEFAVADFQRQICRVAGEDAHFVVDESAAVNDQLPVFEADARTVAVAHADAAEFQVLDAYPATPDDPEPLALGALAVGD